jgi:hypothetical protein
MLKTDIGDSPWRKTGLQRLRSFASATWPHGLGRIAVTQHAIVGAAAQSLRGLFGVEDPLRW